MKAIYDTAIIRKLLEAVFDDETLAFFCFDYFRPVYDKFSGGMGRLVKIHLLVEYCDYNMAFDDLLTLIKERHPIQYDKFAPDLMKSSKTSKGNGDHTQKGDGIPDQAEVEILLKGDLTNFTSEIESATIGAIAWILKIPLEQISVVQRREGSVILRLKMPKEAVEHLIDLNESSDPIMQDLGIQEVKATFTRAIHKAPPISTYAKSDANPKELYAILYNIYDAVVEAMRGLIDTRNMYIALYNDNAGIIEFPLVYVEGEYVSDEEKEIGRTWGPRRFGEREGLTEWIIQHKVPLLIGKDFDRNVEEKGVKAFAIGTKCWLGAPMLLRDKVIGVIGLQNFEREGVFDQGHQDLLMTIASQATVAIENARLFQRAVENERIIAENEIIERAANERQKRLQTLQQISKRMAEASQNPDGVLELITQATNDIIGSDLTSIYLYNQETSTFTGGVSISREGRVEQVRMLPKPEDFAAQIAETQGPAFVDDIEQHPDDTWTFARQHQIQAFASLPLAIAGMQGLPTTVGVLFVNFKQPHVFPEDEQEILRHLANQAAVVIAYAHAQASALAQEQLAALGIAAGTLQHRLGNTINVILPAVMRLRYRVEDDPTSISILDTIERNTLFAGEVIRRMQAPLRPEPFARTNLNSLLREAIQKCIQENRYPQIFLVVDPSNSDQSDVSQPQIIIKTQLDEHLSETYASVGQLTEVFRVLVENAIKAIQPQAGFVTISSKLASDSFGRFAEISVSDTGKGIEEKTYARLFKQPVPRKEFGEGAGLGLWLSQIIVRSHQGTIRLHDTALDKGSTFWVRLPLLTQPPLSNSIQRGEDQRGEER